VDSKQPAPRKFLRVVIRLYPETRLRDTTIAPSFTTDGIGVERLDGNLTMCNYTCLPKNLCERSPIVEFEVAERMIARVPINSMIAHCMGIEEDAHHPSYRIDQLLIFPYSNAFAQRAVHLTLNQNDVWFHVSEKDEEEYAYHYRH
jgi:hypothetical protein